MSGRRCARPLMLAAWLSTEVAGFELPADANAG